MVVAQLKDKEMKQGRVWKCEVSAHFFCCSFFTMFFYSTFSLLVSWLEMSSKLTASSSPRRPSRKVWGGDVRNSPAADFDEALCGDTSAVRSVCCDQQRARRENLAIQIVPAFHRFFFIGAIQVVSKPTPYVGTGNMSLLF